MQVTVVGTGYVGLVAGACFADTGNDVVCLDTDASKVERLKRSEIPIYEPGLSDLVSRGQREGRLKFTTSYAEALERAEIIFLAVGTPGLPSGEPNLEYLKSASESIGAHLKHSVIVVNKSTVPIGSYQVVKEWIESKSKHSVEVVSNPEFLKEGSAIDDFLRPDRVVIGTDKIEAFEKMAELYAPFVRQGNPILHMDVVSAEMTKYACNAFLAARISFMNELARLCESVGGDIESIRRGMATDQRIGKHFLYAGLGYGGSCFPKDVRALADSAKKRGLTLEIVEATDRANQEQARFFFKKISKFFNQDLKGKKIGVLGLAFKPNTDDMREAPALALIESLLNAGAQVTAFDPVSMNEAKKSLGDRIAYGKNAYDVSAGVDAVALCTEWNEFRQLDWPRFKQAMKAPVFFDGRNQYDPLKMKSQGFQYFAIGRSN